MPLKAFFVDIAEEKSRFCSYLCSNVALARCRLLEGKFQLISLIFHLFIFSTGMFFLAIGTETITGDRLCLSCQF